MKKFGKILVLSGAGISEESGIQTFRGSNGMWNNHRIEDVASPKAFIRNPNLVHEFYNIRRSNLLSDSVAPNSAHSFLAKIEEEYKDNFYIITQNVDDLHERAGNKNVIHMHGELLKVICTKCKEKSECRTEIGIASYCPSCGENNSLRPDIVWFGEMPKDLDRCYDLLKKCDLFISVGTSGVVHPAASFVNRVSSMCTKVEVNLKKSEISEYFDLHFYGPASIKVEEAFNELLKIKEE